MHRPRPVIAQKMETTEMGRKNAIAAPALFFRPPYIESHSLGDYLKLNSRYTDKVKTRLRGDEGPGHHDSTLTIPRKSAHSRRSGVRTSLFSCDWLKKSYPFMAISSGSKFALDQDL